MAPMIKILISVFLTCCFLTSCVTTQPPPPLGVRYQFLDTNENRLLEISDLSNHKENLNWLTKRFKRRINNFDCNKDGALDGAEMEIFGVHTCYSEKGAELRSLNTEKSPISDELKTFDINKNGLIEYNEIRTEVVLWIHKKTWEKTDCDNNGGLDTIELGHAGMGGCSHKKLAKPKSPNTTKKKPYITFMDIPPERYGSGLFPVIIYSHGRNGLKGGFIWKHRFVNWGFATILVDHFTLREHNKINPPTIEATRAEVEWRKEDLVSILQDVKNNSLLDSSRITLMGMSRGGYLVLEGLLNEDVLKRAELNNPIKTGVLFYPAGSSCWPGFFEFRPIEQPLIVLYGSNDPGLPMCWKNLLPKLKSSIHPQVVKIYKGAYHAFDGGSKRKTCTSYSDTGSMPNPYNDLKRGRTYKLCMQYNKEAHEKAKRI